MPLIAGVVHREYGRRTGVAFLEFAVRAHVHQRQRRVPVVRVNEHGAGDQSWNPIQHGAREQREPSRVVGIVATAFAVEPRAAERRGDVDEHHLRAGRRLYFTEETHFLAAESQCDLNRSAERGEIRRMISHRAVERHEHDHVRATFRLIIGQAHHGLRQPTRPGERTVFRREMHDRRRPTLGRPNHGRPGAGCGHGGGWH